MRAHHPRKWMIRHQSTINWKSEQSRQPACGWEREWWSSSVSTWQSLSRSPSSRLRPSTSSPPSWTPSSSTGTWGHTVAMRPRPSHGGHCSHSATRGQITALRHAHCRYRHDHRADLRSRSRRRGSGMQWGWLSLRRAELQPLGNHNEINCLPKKWNSWNPQKSCHCHSVTKNPVSS